MLSQKSPMPPSTFLPTHSHLLALRIPCMGHIKFACPMGLSYQWWPTRPSFDTYAARDTSSGVLVSSYCCSTYRVADPSSFSIVCPVIHPIADCEHPLLCLLGPSIVSQETAISGSFQQNLASVCNGVSVWRLIMGWIWNLTFWVLILEDTACSLNWNLNERLQAWMWQSILFPSNPKDDKNWVYMIQWFLKNWNVHLIIVSSSHTYQLSTPHCIPGLVVFQWTEKGKWSS
jgi:hypothetical protein